MKRLVLFVVALVFAFCTTVMAAEPMAAPAAAPATEKAAPAKEVKKVKKMKKAKKMKKEMKKEEKKTWLLLKHPQNKFVKTLCGLKEGTVKPVPSFLFSISKFLTLNNNPQFRRLSNTVVLKSLNFQS